MKQDSFKSRVRMIIFGVSITALVLIAPRSSAACSAPAGGQVPLAQHVVVVIEENTSFANVFPSGMPWLVNQAETKGGYSADNCYTTNDGGSLRDYLMLSAGSLFLQSPYNCGGSACSAALPNPSIFSLADSQPLTWKVYAQSYQNSGAYVTTPDHDNVPCSVPNHYYRRHNGATWYQEVLSNALGSQGAIVDFEQFFIDVANGTLPRYAIIAPDGQYDAHDGCSLATADNFLKNNLDAAGSVYTNLLTLPDFQPGGSGLLMVTFDNGNNDAAGTVFTTLIGPNVKQGYVSNYSYMHQNLLRTMLDALGISSYPNAAASAADMADFFNPGAGSVVINSPANTSTQGPSILVNAAARELSSSIDHLEVWDLYNGVGTKLGNVFADSVNQTYTVSGYGTHQLTVQDIGPAPNYAILHKVVSSYTVTATDGVTVISPPSGSTQASLFPVEAYAAESTNDIDHLEVWCDGQKVGDSPKGARISQWFVNYPPDDASVDAYFPMLTPGTHQLTIEDVGSGSTILHKVTFPVTIAAQNNVYVNAPVNNSTQSSSVYINAYAYELAGATQPCGISGSNQPHGCTLVDHMEVWDSYKGGTPTKLGNSPLGYGSSSLFIDQTFENLAAGSHVLTIQDVGLNSTVLHKATVNITVN
jgi:hypothetical protein